MSEPFAPDILWYSEETHSFLSCIFLKVLLITECLFIPRFSMSFPVSQITSLSFQLISYTTHFIREELDIWLCYFCLISWQRHAWILPSCALVPSSFWASFPSVSHTNTARQWASLSVSAGCCSALSQFPVSWSCWQSRVGRLPFLEGPDASCNDPPPSPLHWSGRRVESLISYHTVCAGSHSRNQEILPPCRSRTLPFSQACALLSEAFKPFHVFCVTTFSPHVSTYDCAFLYCFFLELSLWFGRVFPVSSFR